MTLAGTAAGSNVGYRHRFRHHLYRGCLRHDRLRHGHRHLGRGCGRDAAGNGNTASTSTDNTVTYDVHVGPTVTVNQAAAQADPTNASPVNFTVVFSAAVTDFVAADVTLGGTATGSKSAVVAGSGTTYNVAVSGMTGSGTVIASLAAGVAHDAGARQLGIYFHRQLRHLRQRRSHGHHRQAATQATRPPPAHQLHRHLQ